jgi:hypothetical protein
LRAKRDALDFRFGTLKELIAMSAQSLSALVNLDRLLKFDVTSFKARYNLFELFQRSFETHAFDVSERAAALTRR